MPKREKSEYAYWTVFNNNLIQHAIDIFQRTVAQDLKDEGQLEGYLTNYLGMNGSEQPLCKWLMGQPTHCGLHPDLIFVTHSGSPSQNFAILIDATHFSIVEVRDVRFVEAAEKFATVWEQERRQLIPVLLAEVSKKLGRAVDGSYFQLYEAEEVTIIEAYGAELTSVVPLEAQDTPNQRKRRKK